MKKLVIFLAVVSITTSAMAAMTTLQYEGSVTDDAYYMGSGYTNPLFSIGDDFDLTVTYDDITKELSQISYSISNLESGGGREHNYTVSDFSAYTTQVSDSGDVFIYASRLGSLENLALVYNSSSQFFNHNMNHVDGNEETFAWNFNATVNPVPAPGAILLGSLGVGMVSYLKRRRSL